MKDWKKLVNTKMCGKCKKIKQDTAFPIHIGYFSKFPIGLYKHCNNCAPKRILKSMDNFFSKFNSKM